MGYGLSTRTRLLRAVFHEDHVDLAHAIDYVADEAGVAPGQSYGSAHVRASLLDLLRDLLGAGFIEVGEWESDCAFQPWVVSTEEVLTHIDRRWSLGDRYFAHGIWIGLTAQGEAWA